MYCINCKYSKETNNWFMGCGGFISYFCKLRNKEVYYLSTACKLYKKKWWKF